MNIQEEIDNIKKRIETEHNLIMTCIGDIHIRLLKLEAKEMML